MADNIRASAGALTIDILSHTLPLLSVFPIELNLGLVTDSPSLLQDDDPCTLLLISSFLLFDGRQNEITFEMMNSEGAFPRLLELIQAQKKNGEDGNERAADLHRLLMELLYEMSRIQRVKLDDLGGFSCLSSTISEKQVCWFNMGERLGLTGIHVWGVLGEI